MSLVLVVFSVKKLQRTCMACHFFFVMAVCKNYAAATPRQIDKNRMSKRISNFVLVLSLHNQKVPVDLTTYSVALTAKC